MLSYRAKLNAGDGIYMQSERQMLRLCWNVVYATLNTELKVVPPGTSLELVIVLVSGLFAWGAIIGTVVISGPLAET